MNVPGKFGEASEVELANSAEQGDAQSSLPPPARAAKARAARLRICCVLPPDGTGPSPEVSNTLQAISGQHSVVVLDANPDAGSRGIENFRSIRIKPEGGSSSPLAEAARAPATFYRWLRDEDPFDLVWLSDLHGIGYFAMVAKHLGLAFEETHFAVASSTPTMWHIESASKLIEREVVLGHIHMEQRCAELADTLFVDGDELRKWMADRSYKLEPERISPLADPAGVMEQVCAKLERRGSIPPTPQKVTPQPRVSICLCHHNRPKLLRQALESIRAQDYTNFEVVLVDDGSTDPAALEQLDKLEPEFKARGWKLIRQENLYLGAARNTAVAHASGDLIQFFDDDNVMLPDMLSTMVRAITWSNSGLVTCFCRYFEGAGRPGSKTAKLGHEIRFVGAAQSWSYLRNVVGDAACMIRKEAFEQIGGFTELQRTGKEDMELFHKAMVLRLKLEVIPEVLYFYRSSEDSMKKTQDSFEAGVVRALSPYLASMPQPAGDAIRFLAAAYMRGDQRSGRARRMNRPRRLVNRVGSWIKRVLRI